MIRRRLNENLNNEFKRLVENYENCNWDITNKDTTKFYKYLYEDVKVAKQIYVPYELSGYGNEFFDEVLFEDGSTHYFWNMGKVVNDGVKTKLLVEEVSLTDKAIKEIEYLD